MIGSFTVPNRGAPPIACGQPARTDSGKSGNGLFG